MEWESWLEKTEPTGLTPKQRKLAKEIADGDKDDHTQYYTKASWETWLDKNNATETSHKEGEKKEEWNGKFDNSTTRDDAENDDDKAIGEEESLEELTDGKLEEVEKLKAWEVFLEKGDGGHFSRPSKPAEKPKLIGNNKPVYTTFDGSREVQNDEKQVRGRGVGTPHQVDGKIVPRTEEDVTVSNTIPSPKKGDISTSKKLDSLTPEKIQEHQSNISSDNAQLPDNHPDKMHFSTRDVGTGSWNKEISHPVGKPPEKGSDTKNLGANTTEHKGLPAKDAENKFLNTEKERYNASPEGKRRNAKVAWQKAREEKKPKEEIARLKAAYDKVKNIKKAWESWLDKNDKDPNPEETDPEKIMQSAESVGRKKNPMIRNIYRSWEGWLEKMQGAGDARYGNQHLTGMEQKPVADDESIDLSAESEENNEKQEKTEDKEDKDNKPYKALSQE